MFGSNIKTDSVNHINTNREKKSIEFHSNLFEFILNTSSKIYVLSKIKIGGSGRHLRSTPSKINIKCDSFNINQF